MTEACRGSARVVVYARDASGRYPAKEFMESLEDDAKRDRERVGIMKLFSMMCEQGHISNREKFKILEGTNPSLCEFKGHQVRVIGAFDGQDPNGVGRIVLLHGLIKKTDKLNRSDIDIAHRVLSEHRAAAGKEKRR